MTLLRRLFSSSSSSPSQTQSQQPPQNTNSVNMGSCHSSQDTQHTVPAQRRSVAATPASKSLHPHVAPQPYQQHQQHQQQPSQIDTGADIWSPPPYSSTTTNTNTTGAPFNDTAYSFLSTFDTIFLVDDSTSMRGKRWREAEDAIAAIAPICTHYDADGIDIYFLNHRNQQTSTAGTADGYKNVLDASGVREIFKSVSPSGATPVGTRLHHILKPYLSNLSTLTAQGREAELKPLNIIVITDGVFTDDAESVIVSVAKKLDSPSIQAVSWQVGIQFFQVGDDEQARAFLVTLDDDLTKRRSYDGIRDIVDTVPWKGERGRVLNAEGILKCVLGAVNKRYDKVEASR
ncbi:hypothetical protein BDW59DRAFT_149473 [Aspergillus cavernicola]|uniref:VWFA domain-containing protein n=1 Tax=Aspergillus cavernicola TaxID=176166 RepID=A0ABR4I3I3_9EURO